MGHSTEAPRSHPHREPHCVYVCVNVCVCRCVRGGERERAKSVFYQWDVDVTGRRVCVCWYV